MDTKLKKGNIIRAMIYRAIAFGLLLATIVTVTTGIQALKEFVVNQNYQILYGDITGLSSFQEYIGRVYNEGMMAYAGVGDDNGYPLEDNGTSSVREQATLSFYDAIAENDGNLLYYVYDNNYKAAQDEYTSQMHTNFESPIFSEYDGHLIIPDDVLLLFYQNGPEHTLTSNSGLKLEYTRFSYMPNAGKAQDLNFVLAIKRPYAISQVGTLAAMQSQAAEYSRQLKNTGICAGLFILFVILSLATGKAGREGKRLMTGSSLTVLLEIKLAILAISIFAGWNYIFHPFITQAGLKNLLEAFFWGLVTYPILIDFKTNGLRLFESSIPVKLYTIIAEWGQNESWRKRLGIFSGITGVGSLCCGIVVFFLSHNLWSDLNKDLSKAGVWRLFKPAAEKAGTGMAELSWIIGLSVTGLILLAISIYFAVKFVREVEAITKRLSDIRNGNLHQTSPLVPGSFLNRTADDVNMLESGIETAVEEKSRSDRMQIELITNVSHDLKTPLTSIINYVDLLCDEEMSPAARDYVNALRDKSYKLKSMVQDVFEVSKASTGNMAVSIVTLDLGKLIRQTLADMDERIAESNLTFKINLPQDPVFIEGDGDRLYRVFQNLFVNAVQYSLDYSRVHVSLTVQDAFARASVKNTSRGELDFDSIEIMERFVRADASRTTDGSGLGLSIAKSFTEACGGEFEIMTDADMFTAVVRLPLSPPPSAS